MGNPNLDGRDCILRRIGRVECGESGHSDHNGDRERAWWLACFKGKSRWIWDNDPGHCAELGGQTVKERCRRFCWRRWLWDWSSRG